MDFDHLPGFIKLATISQMVMGGYTMSTLLEEAAKCEVVCSNCHRSRTKKRKAAETDKEKRLRVLRKRCKHFLLFSA